MCHKKQWEVEAKLSSADDFEDEAPEETTAEKLAAREDEKL